MKILTPTGWVLASYLLVFVVGFSVGRVTAAPVDMTTPRFSERATLMLAVGDSFVSRTVRVPWVPDTSVVLCFGRPGVREATCFYRNRQGDVSPVTVVLQEVLT